MSQMFHQSVILQMCGFARDSRKPKYSDLSIVNENFTFWIIPNIIIYPIRTNIRIHWLVKERRIEMKLFGHTRISKYL